MVWLAAGALLFVLGLLLAESRQANRRLKRRLAALEAARRAEESPRLPVAGVSEIEELLLLRAELLEAKQWDPERRDALLQDIDTLLARRLAARGLRLGTPHWLSRRDAAWVAFIDRQPRPPNPPPWRPAPLPPPPEIPPGPEIPQGPSPTAIAPPRPAVPAAKPLRARPAVAKAAIPDAGESLPPRPAPEVSRATMQAPAFDYALGPEEPSVLEHALATVSGWPRLLAPFLAQNIGWFIGAFCFVAGSMFLVSYTSGFNKSLTIHASLLLYTLFIFWSGYTLRRRRPDLETASNVLLSVAMLLVPLDVASAARLLGAGLPAVLPTLVAAITIALTLGAVGFASSLASGLMDRALQRGHAALFLSLTAAQLAVPLVARVPAWPLLATLHLGLLGLLAYALARHSEQWLRDIFVQRRKASYYTAGTLVYAAVVSFVHLTWGAGERLHLPDGYYGPFLMALAGLLLLLDVRLKEWEQELAYLSRFSFVIHALAAVALLIAAPYPLPRVLTLVLAVTLYGTMVARYLTPTPVLILIPLLAWLYATLVLQPLPPAWHLVAGTPGLLGLYWAYRWTLRRKAWGLARAGYWGGTITGAVLVVWTLASSHSGVLATLSAAAAAAIAYLVLGQAPPSGAGSQPRDLRNTPWLYAVTTLATVSVIALPGGSADARYQGVALGLSLLATVCAVLGLRARGLATPEGRRTEVWVNSALVLLGSAVILAVGLATGAPYAPGSLLVLAVGGAVALWLSVGLGVAALAYLGILLWGGCGALIRIHYFPGTPMGTLEMTLALAIWALLWWLDRHWREAKEGPQTGASLRVLWLFSARGPIERD